MYLDMLDLRHIRKQSYYLYLGVLQLQAHIFWVRKNEKT
jgi:hypothetical protein